MVHGTFATLYVRENFRNMTHLWQKYGTRNWAYGLTGSLLFMAYVSKPPASASHESRIEGSKHYRLNMAEKFDNPIYRLPPRADGTHPLPEGLPKPKHPH